MMIPEVSHEYRSADLQIRYDLQVQPVSSQNRSYRVLEFFRFRVSHLNLCPIRSRVMPEHAFSFSLGLVSPLTGQVWIGLHLIGICPHFWQAKN